MTRDEAAGRLRLLEADYFEAPAFARGADLREINALRALLGLPEVDALLRPPAVAKPEPPKPKAPDFTRARAAYARHLAKEALMRKHREYAERLCKATEGTGMTPVRPLATMGTRGGELLCDHCGKPIPLEGGRFHNVSAGAAYAAHPVPDWRSYVSGGVVFEITLNGTVRVYHGHVYNAPHECSTKGHDAIESAAAAHRAEVPDGLGNELYDFFRAEFPDDREAATARRVGEVLSGLYGFDPGVGVNRPD